MTTPDILILEDDPMLARNLAIACRQMGHFSVGAANTRQGRMHSEIHGGNLRLIVMAVQPADPSRQALWSEIRKRLPHVPVLLTATEDQLPEVVARRDERTEYLTKPFDGEAFLVTARQLLEAVSRGEPARQAEALPILIGSSPPMQRLLMALATVSASDQPVLLGGEAGTGKSLVARLIHTHGVRAGREFVELDCRAVKPDQWEAVMFRRQSDGESPAGAVPRAEGGSLHLENVESLPPAIQERLLRLIEQRSYQTIEGVGPATVSIRWIVSTTADLNALADQRAFRRDLLYRISAHPVQLPPLRERPEDLPALAISFLARPGAPEACTLSEEALQLLRRHHWPGNLTELKETLESAATRAGRGPMLGRHLPALLQAATSQELAHLGTTLDEAIAGWLKERITLNPSDYDSIHAELEGMALRHLLRTYNNRPTNLAAALDMNRTTLRKKLEAAGLAKPRKRPVRRNP